MQRPKVEPVFANFEYSHGQVCSPQGQQVSLSMGVATQLLQDTKRLLEMQLWESALILISFLQSGNQQTRELDRTECLVLQGDALRGMHENRRAIVYYRRALRTARACSPADTNLKDTAMNVEPGQTNRTSVIFKISLCLEELGDWNDAVKELQAVPRANRNVTINSFLGRLYHRLGRKTRAVDAYKACLKQQPLAIEAAIALASAGVPYNTIASLAPIMGDFQVPSDAHPPQPSDSRDCSPTVYSEPFMQHSERPPRENSTFVDLSPTRSRESPTFRTTVPFVGVNTDPVHGSGTMNVHGMEGAVGQICSALRDEIVFPLLPPAPTPRVWDDMESGGLVQSQPSLEHDNVPMEDSGPCGGAMDNMTAETVCQQTGASLRINHRIVTPPVSSMAVPAESLMSHGRPPKRRRVSAPLAPSVKKEDSQAAFMQQTQQLQHCGTSDTSLLGTVEPAFGSPFVPLAGAQLSQGSGWLSHSSKDQENDSAEKRASPSSSTRSETLAEEHKVVGWYGTLVQAHVHLCTPDNNAAARLFNSVAATFPGEIHTLLGAASALLAAGDQVGALSTFQRARAVDSLNVRGMDAYARLLLEVGSTKELRSLNQDMLAVDPDLPEVWAVTACFWLQHSDWQRALDAVKRGLTRRPDHVGLRLAKGRCLLLKKDFEAALIEFRSLLRCSVETIAFHGAVHACLKLNRHSEAHLHARAALRALPGSATAHYLFGCVLHHSPRESSEEAEKHMRQALELDPGHREAAVVVVKMLQQRQDYASAMALLRQQLHLRPTDVLYVRLGQVARAAGQLGSAVDAFQAALGLNAGNRTAIEALEEIGTFLKNKNMGNLQPAPYHTAADAMEAFPHPQTLHEESATVDWVAHSSSPAPGGWAGSSSDLGGAPMDA